MAIDEKVFKSKLAPSKIAGLTGEEILNTMNEEEREYLVTCLKSYMSDEEVEALTENELHNKIVSYIIDTESYADFDDFTYCISKRTAGFIRNQAEFHGIDEGLALENLIEICRVRDPELGALLAIMNINHILRSQTDEQKTKAMLVIASSMLEEVIDMTDCSIDEAFAQTQDHFGAFYDIVDKMKNRADEEDEE